MAFGSAQPIFNGLLFSWVSATVPITLRLR